jgi:hypothetical protein
MILYERPSYPTPDLLYPIRIGRMKQPFYAEIGRYLAVHENRFRLGKIELV